MVEPLAPFDPSYARRTLFGALVDAAKRFGMERKILIDGDERSLTYREIIRASLALGYQLTKGTRFGDSVGVMLPTGVGSLIAVFALCAYGRTPTMVNFTSGLQNVRTAIRMARVTRVVTAHRFIKLGKLEALEQELGREAQLIYLEDVREKLSLRAKAAAAIGTIAPKLIARHPSPDRPAAILFTSGTEGEPKGVVLSHANILANVEQTRAHLAIHEDDVLFNPLPTFHCFGLTVGSMVPLFLGVTAVLHPTPRQPHEVVRRIREHGATIVLATDTFIHNMSGPLATTICPASGSPFAAPRDCMTRHGNWFGVNARLSCWKGTVSRRHHR